MRSPLPFPCVPDRPYKILLVQVGTLSFSHPSFGVPVLFIYLLDTNKLTRHKKKKLVNKNLSQDTNPKPK